MNIMIDILPRFTKMENKILNMIIDDTLKRKKLIYTFSELNLSTIKGSHFLTLERFIKKGISYNYKNIEGIIMPFENFFIQNNNVNFQLTSYFREILFEENNLKFLDLKYVLKFEESFSKYFYYNFIIGVEKEKNLIIPLDELRVLLHLKEYNRFYDFEINVLKKLKKDIDLNSKYLLEFKKIKNGEFKNNKVIALEFSIINKNSKIKDNKVNELMALISQYIKNFKLTYDILYNAVEHIEFKELKKTILFLTATHNNNFSFENELQRIIKNKTKIINSILIESFYTSHKNPLKLQNEIYKKLSNSMEIEIFKDNITSTNFLKKLYFAKEGEEIFFEGKFIIISIKYSLKNDSLIEIYKIESK